jgi:glucose/mannose-6-phosphate isomerase
MLDDLKYIHQRDGQDALGIAEKQWQQYTHKFDITTDFGDWRPSSILLAGMGGSAQAALALAASGTLPVPFEVVRNYDLPVYVDENYMLICCSFSGNTEETLSVLDQALGLPEDKRPKIVLMSAGGQVQARAKELSLPYIEIPSISQPRFSFGYQLAALCQLFEGLGLLQGTADILKNTSEKIENAVSQWRPDVAAKDNWAKQLANDIAGKSPVIYAGPKLFPAAYKWKIDFNENAKNVAWCNQFPEFNHNEFIGWSSHPVEKPYSIIELRSQLEHPRIQKRFELSDKLLSGRWQNPLVIDIPKGGHILEELGWAVALGDFVSVYLALLNGVNPSPVDLVEKFKKELG